LRILYHEEITDYVQIRKKWRIRRMKKGDSRERGIRKECGETPISRHSREGGSPEGIENPGFLLPQE